MRTLPRLKIFSGKLSLIALVDLLFLLFVFFLVSTSLVFQPGVPVDLPVGHEVSSSPAERIIVTISRTGDVYVNDHSVADYELPNKLRRKVEQRAEFTMNRLNLTEEDLGAQHAPRIVLQADKRVEYEKIIEVASLARSLGLGVYLITDPDRNAGEF